MILNIFLIILILVIGLVLYSACKVASRMDEEEMNENTEQIISNDKHTSS